MHRPIIAGARHGPGALTNREALRPCGQLVETIFVREGRKQESPACGVSAVPMVTRGGGVSSSLGLRGFALEREVVPVKALWF